MERIAREILDQLADSPTVIANEIKKLEKELEESRIAILLSQMQPHFIHNILNVIYYLIGKDPIAAQGAISKFSDHLRNNLEAISQKELITFRKELDHIHPYSKGYI